MCVLRQTQLCQKTFLGRYKAVALWLYLESKAGKVGSGSHTLATPGQQQLGARCREQRALWVMLRRNRPGPPGQLLRSKTASSGKRALHIKPSSLQSDT